MSKEIKFVGLTVFDALFVLFLGLKLAGEITWVWPLIISPYIVAWGISYVSRAVIKYKIKKLTNKNT